MTLRTSTREDYAARIARVERFLEANLDGAIDPAALARTAALSMHHFHRIFRAQLGETIMQHLRRLRLERAARRLRNAADTARLLDVAVEAGYESHEAFTRAFQARFGVAPSTYRDRAVAEGSPRVVAWQAQRIERPAAPVTVRPFDGLRVVCMRHRGSYATVGETWGRMLAWAGAHGLGAAPLYGICPDDPEVTEEMHLRFDAAVVVPEHFVPTSAGLTTTEIPAGTYAVGLHVGPYHRLHETYLDVIGRWFPESGYELATDAVVEHYLNDPSCTPEADLRTEVRVRIAE